MSIEETIGKYVHLEQAGASWKGRCPFHQEKTPSFIVNPRSQTFYCFGCHEHGSVVDFVKLANARNLAPL